MTYLNTLQRVIGENNGLIFTKDIVAAGIPRSYLSELVRKDQLARLEQGVYITKDALEDRMYTLQRRKPSIVFSHATALFLYNLSVQEPLTYSVTVPVGYNTKNIKNCGITVFSVKKELYDLGLTTLKTPFGRSIKTYNMERTLCDLLRNRNKLDKAILVEALKRYGKQKDKNIPQLMSYAESFRVSKLIRDCLELILGEENLTTEKLAPFLGPESNQRTEAAFPSNYSGFFRKSLAAGPQKETLQEISKERAIHSHFAQVQIQCFGIFRVLNKNGDVRFRTEKAQELLAFLIDQRGNFISRSKIIDSLWEDYEGDKALIHFNTTLHYLKKALLQHGIQAPIEFHKGFYRLNVGALACDYLRFYEFASGAEAINSDNVAEYEAAAALYTDEYLSGQEYSWAEINRQMLRDWYIFLLLEIADHYKSTYRYKKVAEWMKTGLLHEPLHREINYRLLEALLLDSDYSSAYSYYNIYRNGLKKKLNREPDDALQGLMRC